MDLLLRLYFRKGDRSLLFENADEDINLRQKSSIFHHAEERDTGILVRRCMTGIEI